MISVIVCTKRPEFIENIIRNYKRQSVPYKELILLLHSKEFNLSKVQKTMKDLQIQAQCFQLDKNQSLGECLNYGNRIATYDLVAKLDDDDYYEDHFLKEAVQTITSKQCAVVGKGSFQIYLQAFGELRLYHPHHQNRWVTKNVEESFSSKHFLCGATMVWNRCLVGTNPFPDVNQGEDSGLQRRCFERGLPMYSTSEQHYIHIRYNDPAHHTSDMKDTLLRSRSTFIRKINHIHELK
ncbi:hypothetical protein N780_17790 [Pontibacillus chungwhensis BH030062]|uniref:Glycosyltransferase 2-like domain-containing protein n=1 Tax=Pontibacillus chungwhensis BH030062 TaxID=1385513 RepID=A0A0A2UX86_9BACI|nr:glycosyltransferase family 2 protein [Pontibacillus chungwhensis]KGP91151.1 hypothetical protein N780_17790 [Pontibacillus chungwhensis BH030062]